MYYAYATSPTNPRAASKQVSLRGDVLGYGKVYMRVPHEKSCSKIRTFAEKQSLSAKKAGKVSTATSQQQQRNNPHTTTTRKEGKKKHPQRGRKETGKQNDDGRVGPRGHRRCP